MQVDFHMSASNVTNKPKNGKKVVKDDCKGIHAPKLTLYTHINCINIKHETQIHGSIGIHSIIMPQGEIWLLVFQDYFCRFCCIRAYVWLFWDRSMEGMAEELRIEHKIRWAKHIRHWYVAKYIFKFIIICKRILFAQQINSIDAKIVHRLMQKVFVKLIICLLWLPIIRLPFNNNKSAT